MSYREISLEDREWFLSTHGQKFAEAQFAELDDKPCTATESALLTLGTVFLASLPVIAFIFFMVA